MPIISSKEHCWRHGEIFFSRNMLDTLLKCGQLPQPRNSLHQQMSTFWSSQTTKWKIVLPYLPPNEKLNSPKNKIKSIWKLRRCFLRLLLNILNGINYSRQKIIFNFLWNILFWVDSQILHTQVDNQTLIRNSNVPIYGHKKNNFLS